MAATFTLTGAQATGNGLMMVVGTFVLDNSYATGGEVLDLSTYFVSTTTPVIIPHAISATYGYRSDQGTASGNKIVAYVLADGTEAGSSSNLSAVVGNVVAYGIQAGSA